MYERFPDLVSPCSFEVAHACQIAIGHLEKGVLTLDHVPGLFASVPRPMSQGGVKAAAQTLFEFTSRFTREHHRRFHSDASPRGCKFDPAGYVVHVYAGIPEWHTIDIAAIVRAWVQRYGAAFTAAHSPEIAARARARFSERHASVHRIYAMARDLGCSPTTLWRRVTAGGGESPVRRRTRARVVAAFHLLRTTNWKIEAIARAVGWRSAKDLYRAFETLLGLTPAQVRRLSVDAAADVLNRLVRDLVRSTGSAPHVGERRTAASGRATGRRTPRHQ